MTDQIFHTVWSNALNTTDRDEFISDWALSSIWGDAPEANIPQERINHLAQIWDAAHMNVKEICKEAKLTQAQFATKFCIPKRTVEDWCRGVSKCPDYTRLLIIKALNML